MEERQVNKPIKINQDKDPKYLSPEEARYMLNTERNTGGGGKSIAGKTSLFPANEFLCETDIEGTPFFNGAFRSDATNEVYAFYLTDQDEVYIIRVNGDKTCQLVWHGSNECVGLSNDPEHSIEQWRCYLKYEKFCAHMGGKQLIFTNGFGAIGQIDVEASIETDSFSTPFFQRCEDACARVQMCVPEICGPLHGEFSEPIPGEADLNNKLIDVAVQVRFRHVYYDQRASEWSDISTTFFQDSNGCFEEGEGFSRCLTLRVPVGNPLVDKIQIAFRNNNESQWYTSETVDKYMPYSDEDQKWYERELADLLNYSDEDCSFDYIFCNDKDADPIDVKETSRVFNPIPRQAQGLFRIKDSLAFYNYIKGSCPLLESEVKKMEISLNDTDSTNCSPELVTVTFFLIVHRRGVDQNFNMPIFRMGGSGGLNIPDDKSDRAWFGGADFNGTPTPNDGFTQFFRGDIRNFIGYVEGTNYWSEMKQYVKSATAGSPPQYLGAPVASLSDSGWATALRNLRQSGTYYFQQGSISVPKGTKGFIRIASHLKEDGSVDSQDESTFVIGSIPSLISYQGLGFPKDITSILNKNKKELYFDACNGSVYLDPVLIVGDNDIQDGSDKSAAVAGYIRDIDGKPLENIEVWCDSSLASTTDHNGFYHFFHYPSPGGYKQLDIRADRSASGVFTNIKFQDVTLQVDSLVIQDIEIDEPTYQSNYYTDVQVAVRDCDNNPVGGVRVAMSGSKYEVSDSITGIATFKIRNNSTRNRSVRGLVMDAKNCLNISCADDCNFCLPSTVDTLLGPDFSGVPYVNLALNYPVNIATAITGKRGLKSGGLYKWDLVVKGKCGRVSAAYPVTVLNGSVDTGSKFMRITKTQEKGSASFGSISYNATGLTLPDWADCVSLVRSANLNPYELQWQVDKIERVDGKIRLRIQSLNDYNAKYNFKSNTVYQFAEGDRVEFIANGNGDIFDIASNGLLNYKILSPFTDLSGTGLTEAPADFFNEIVIENDGKLSALTVGAKIEMQRPRDYTQENTPMFAVANLEVIEVSGQKMLAEPVGNFTTFDTYFVTRTVGSLPTQIFEHRNPSDFWGDALLGLSDIGKVYFENRYENEKRFGRNITINSVGQFNRFGDLEKTLDAPEHGDLTGVAVYDGKIGIGIGEYDNFLFQVSDEFLRVGSDGVVRAAPADALISDTEPKVTGKFGCQYPHVGSIHFGDGYATWADVAKGAYVKNDFSSAKDISEGVMSSYFRKKWNYMQAENSTAPSIDKFRFVTGFNFHTNAIILTMRRLTGGNVNNEKAELLAENETVLIDPKAEEFLTFASFTYNGYSNMNFSDGKGCAFISFDGAEVYVHPVISNTFNRFSGVAVDRVITIALNQEPDRVKRAVSVEIQDSKMWFVSKVLVDNPQYESEIPPVRFKKKEDKWNGSFLSNKNSTGGIYAQGAVATKPRGFYVLVTFVRDNTDALKYNTIDNSKRIEFSSLDMIMFKYFHSAQSGFKENL